MIRRDFPRSDDVYGRHVVLLYGSNKWINDQLQKASKGMAREYDDDVFGSYRIVHQNGGGNKAFICVSKQKGKPLNEASVIVHECAHHVFDTLNNRSIRITRRTEEAFCYYLDWMVNKCLRAMASRGNVR